MEVDISSLKESSDFLNVLFENITSAVFIVDKSYKIHTVNNTFQILFEKHPPEVIGYLCGDVIGCGYAYGEQKSCGSTSHCKSCDLRSSSHSAVLKKQTVYRKVFTREIVLREKKLKKHFLYSTRPIHFRGNDMAMIIVDDITESEEQKKVIEEKNREIMQSILYARGIQKTILPEISMIRKILPDSFVLYLPKDVISGDFYWVAEKDNRKYFAVADCTGHGVPGAIMSMLGITLLNEIVHKKAYTTASEILDMLRAGIIQYLKQKGNLGEHKDGMDVAICILEKQEDRKNHKAITQLQYSGANMPLLLMKVSDNTSAVSERIEMNEIKPDKQPVGIYFDMKPFTNHTERLHEGDLLYLSTDGFSDQFGGKEKKKYRTNRMKTFLNTIHSFSCNDQLQDLEIEFLKWKGENEQVDDVCVMGVRI